MNRRAAIFFLMGLPFVGGAAPFTVKDTRKIWRVDLKTGELTRVEAKDLADGETIEIEVLSPTRRLRGAYRKDPLPSGLHSIPLEHARD